MNISNVIGSAMIGPGNDYIESNGVKQFGLALLDKRIETVRRILLEMRRRAMRIQRGLIFVLFIYKVPPGIFT